MYLLDCIRLYKLSKMKFMDSLKGSKTPAFDNIPTIIFRYCNDILAYHLAYIINQSKVIERVVHTQLYDHLENHNMLLLYQFDFRQNCSRAQAVTYYIDCIRKHMGKGQLKSSLELDLRKAFDTENHGRLQSKLELYGMKRKQLLWFQS